MKIINNSAVEFFSSFCPSFYEKKIIITRETIERCSRFSECRRHEWGVGYERWMTPLVRVCVGRPQENFLIQDVCRSDSNAFFEAYFFLSYQAYFTSISCISDANDSFSNVLTTILTPRWVSSSDGIKLDSLLVILIQISVVVVVVFCVFFFFFFWGGGGVLF